MTGINAIYTNAIVILCYIILERNVIENNKVNSRVAHHKK